MSSSIGVIEKQYTRGRREEEGEEEEGGRRRGRKVNEVLSVLPNKAMVGVTSWLLKKSSSWMTSSNTTIFGKSSHADCVCPQTMALLTGHSLCCHGNTYLFYFLMGGCARHPRFQD